MKLNPDFVSPEYNARCFADIPQTISYFLTGQGLPSLASELLGEFDQKYETVILFFIDAFGWRFFEKYCDHYPFLKEINQNGTATQLTSQFPSTTTAHVTCIHTGLPVGQSGLYEWYIYEPQLDAIIAPLLYSFAGDEGRDTLRSADIRPDQLYPTHTFYQDLRQHGVQSTLFVDTNIANSPYTTTVCRGSEIVPYRTLPEALTNLSTILKSQKSRGYYYLYFGLVDSICHRYGPDSAQVEAEIDTLLTTLDRLFLQQQAGKLRNTLFMLIADHGQIAVEPDQTVYLNLEPDFSGIERYLKANQAGKHLVPAGSARDMFLHVKEDRLDEAQAFLADRLSDRADVLKIEDLIRLGYFGPQPVSQTFLARVGNLVVLPFPNRTVWWYEKDKFDQPYRGLHGGLTRQEMEIPLLLYNLSV